MDIVGIENIERDRETEHVHKKFYFLGQPFVDIFMTAHIFFRLIRTKHFVERLTYTTRAHFESN